MQLIRKRRLKPACALMLGLSCAGTASAAPDDVFMQAEPATGEPLAVTDMLQPLAIPVENVIDGLTEVTTSVWPGLGSWLVTEIVGVARSKRTSAK